MTWVQGVIPQLGDIYADVWVDERHRREMEVTENPIEYGSPAADHAIIKAQELGVTFGVSNTPLEASESFSADNRVDEAREMLYQLQDDKVFLTVKTITGGEYTNMLLTGIGWSTDNSSTNAVQFNLDLKEVIVKTTQQTEYQALPPEVKTKKQTDPKSKKGKKPKSKLPSDKKTSRSRSSNRSRSAANAAREGASTSGGATSASTKQESYTNAQKAKGAAASKQLESIKKSDNRTQLKKIVDSI